MANILSLCSGVGGLDLAVKLALGDSARTIAYVEREAFCCEVLAARMESGALDVAPIWSDIESFDGSSLRGKVDLVIAGFPCQPVSLAGKGMAQEDDRWLWPDITRIVRDVGASFVFLENVPGLLVRGFGEVLGCLSSLGFDAEWTSLRAADLGAPHIRNRVFILAARHGGALWLEPERGEGAAPKAERWDAEPPHDGADVDADGLTIWPPGPDEEWNAIPAELHLARPKSDFRRMAHGLSSRLDELRAYGNGVVPVVAAHALVALAKRTVARPPT